MKGASRTDADQDAGILRYVEFVLIPDEAGLHPVDRRIAEHGDLTREQIWNFNLLPDGTICLLYQLSGDIEAAREICETDAHILEYTLSQTADSVYAYVQMEPTGDLRRLLRIPQEFDLINDLPSEYTTQGGIRISVVGDFDAIREAAAAVPSGFRMELEGTGVYQPAPERIFAGLTARQQETLRAAVELGYYQNPRQATYKEIAAHLDRTDATVGEHLRNIEAEVMRTILP